MSVPRTKPCARPGCARLALADCTYCSRSCAMRVARAQQTPAKRREIALLGRDAQRREERERLLARVRWFAQTEEQRILLAYSLGKRVAKMARYRHRQTAA